MPKNQYVFAPRKNKSQAKPDFNLGSGRGIRLRRNCANLPMATGVFPHTYLLV